MSGKRFSEKLMVPRLTAASLAVISLLAAPQIVRAEIAVGVVGPMSGSFGIFGAQMMAGAEQAIADINAAGGVLGEPLTLEVADDKCDRKQAESVANQMIGREVALIVGHLCSGASIVSSPTYNDAGIIQISPGARAARYTDERAGPGTFRLAGRDDQQGPVAGAFLAKHFAGSRIAVVHDDSPYGVALAEATLKAMNEAGKRETLYEAHPANDRDFTPLFSRLASERIDVLFFAGDHTEAALIIRRLRDEGLQVALVSGDTLMTQEFLAIAGKAGEGALMTYPPDPSRNAPAAEVVERMARRDIFAEGYVLYAYAAVQAWAAAVIAAGSTDFAAVADALAEGTFDTVIGSISFDAKGDVKLPAYVVYEWRDGEYDYAPM
jgi:branched-chain amino acid transport system substrate-binding protein